MYKYGLIQVHDNVQKHLLAPVALSKKTLPQLTFPKGEKAEDCSYSPTLGGMR